MKIIKNPITKDELRLMAERSFGDLIKAVVDIEKEIMVVDGELHADEEALLIEKENSKREHIWGINLYPNKEDDEFIEFDSVINLKPSFGNRSRSVDNPEIRDKIKKLVKKLILE